MFAWCQVCCESEPTLRLCTPSGRAKRYYMVFIYCAVASLLSADQNLMAPNLTCARSSLLSSLSQ